MLKVHIQARWRPPEGKQHSTEIFHFCISVCLCFLSFSYSHLQRIYILNLRSCKKKFPLLITKQFIYKGEYSHLHNNDRGTLARVLNSLLKEPKETS